MDRRRIERLWQRLARWHLVADPQMDMGPSARIASRWLAGSPPMSQPALLQRRPPRSDATGRAPSSALRASWAAGGSGDPRSQRTVRQRPSVRQGDRSSARVLDLREGSQAPIRSEAAHRTSSRKNLRGGEQDDVRQRASVRRQQRQAAHLLDLQARSTTSLRGTEERRTPCPI